MAKKIITEKQKLILVLLYIFRFLTSRQIQEFLRHKDHRRINAWLKDLEEKEYIVREFTPIFGTLTKPAVCYLAAKGRAVIRHGYSYYFPKYLKRIARDSKASKAFRIRCQIVADWYLMLFPAVSPITKTIEKKESGKMDKKEKAQQTKTKTGITIVDTLITELVTGGDNEEKIPFNALQFFTPCYFPSSVLLPKIKPDGYLRKRTKSGTTHCFLFVLDAYIPRLMLRYLVQRIFTILDEEYWEDETIHSLQFFILCPNNMIIVYLKKLLPSFLEKYYGGKPVEFHLATRKQLYKRKQEKKENTGWRTLSSEDY